MGGSTGCHNLLEELEGPLGCPGCRGSAPSPGYQHPEGLRRWLESTRATWDVARVSLAQGWATILVWSFSWRAGEQRVHKEREKELTVPWMGAGVKDEAVAMEA